MRLLWHCWTRALISTTLLWPARLATSTNFKSSPSSVFLLDMNYEEETKSKGEVILGLLPVSSKIIFLETRNMKLQREDVEHLIEVSTKGALDIFDRMKDFLRKSFEQRLALQLV